MVKEKIVNRINGYIKVIQLQAWLGGKDYPLELVQEWDIWPYWKRICAQTRIQSFPSPRLIAIPKLKSSVYSTFYPLLEREHLDFIL